MQGSAPLWLLALLGCPGEATKDGVPGDTSPPPDTAPVETGESGGDSAETGDSAPGDSGETGGTVDTADSADTGDSAVVVEEICNNGIDDDGDGTSNGCAWSGDYVIDDVAGIIGPENAGDKIGASLAALGDLDGDGFDDFAVGAPRYDPDAADIDARGAIYIVRGSASGVPVNLADAWTRIEGDNAEANLGLYISAAGDVDGDGRVDLLAYTTDRAADGSTASYLITAIDDAVVSTDAATAVFVSSNPDDRTGDGPGGGDLTGDGAVDVAVSVGRESDDLIAICDGAGSGERDPTECGTLVGYGETVDGSAVDIARDLNGDGVADLLVASPRDCRESAGCTQSSAPNGAAYVFSGPLLGMVAYSDAALTLIGEGHGDAVTYSDETEPALCALDDENGDGYADIALGAYYWDAAHANGQWYGVVYVVNGPASGAMSLDLAPKRIEGATYVDGVGVQVASPGDMDRDGFADLAFSARGSRVDAAASSVLLAHGPIPSGTTAVVDAEFRADTSGSGYTDPGRGLLAAGDFDGDDTPDLLVSDYLFAPDRTADVYDGRLWLIAGRGF